MTTGQRIRAARKAAGLTQEELAKILGIPFQGISQWERDVRNPKYETLQRIAEALKISVGELFEVQPLPDKMVEFDLGNRQEKVMVPGNALETDIFDAFLTAMGFKTYIDPTRFENPKGKNGDVWIIEDIRNNKFYTACTEDLNRLMDSILSYTKFQVYDLLRNLDTINEHEIGHYSTAQKPPETDE